MNSIESIKNYSNAASEEKRAVAFLISSIVLGVFIEVGSVAVNCIFFKYLIKTHAIKKICIFGCPYIFSISVISYGYLRFVSKKTVFPIEKKSVNFALPSSIKNGDTDTYEPISLSSEDSSSFFPINPDEGSDREEIDRILEDSSEEEDFIGIPVSKEDLEGGIVFNEEMLRKRERLKEEFLSGVDEILRECYGTLFPEGKFFVFDKGGNINFLKVIGKICSLLRLKKKICSLELIGEEGREFLEGLDPSQKDNLTVYFLGEALKRVATHEFHREKIREIIQENFQLVKILFCFLQLNLSYCFNEMDQSKCLDPEKKDRWFLRFNKYKDQVFQKIAFGNEDRLELLRSSFEIGFQEGRCNGNWIFLLMDIFFSSEEDFYQSVLEEIKLSEEAREGEEIGEDIKDEGLLYVKRIFQIAFDRIFLEDRFVDIFHVLIFPETFLTSAYYLKAPNLRKMNRMANGLLKDFSQLCDARLMQRMALYVQHIDWEDVCRCFFNYKERIARIVRHHINVVRSISVSLSFYYQVKKWQEYIIPEYFENSMKIDEWIASSLIRKQILQEDETLSFRFKNFMQEIFPENPGIVEACQIAYAEKNFWPFVCEVCKIPLRREDLLQEQRDMRQKTFEQIDRILHISCEMFPNGYPDIFMKILTINTPILALEKCIMFTEEIPSIINHFLSEEFMRELPLYLQEIKKIPIVELIRFIRERPFRRKGMKFFQNLQIFLNLNFDPKKNLCILLQKMKIVEIEEGRKFFADKNFQVSSAEILEDGKNVFCVACRKEGDVFDIVKLSKEMKDLCEEENIDIEKIYLGLASFIRTGDYSSFLKRLLE